ncbi:MAG: gluconate 2-dehydrogenase subunit 3 family protein [Cytophagia bacterium]|nr:MAG: gluconate 2-dehydrogenase subunit 3 family protein [Cytophagales bacterium]TAG40417.1 MAG: gluconate 2-dehydrogenase subunit 3 family protein [Cytophagia bacterium]TAG81982.1 MAG: gluconate 2-dehydrogenase subunit 3 family protein [Cytophagales bacterium]
MKRRDTLRTLAATAFGAAVLPTEAAATPPPTGPVPVKIPGGRLKEEAIRDAKLMADKFFTPHELKTVTALCDIIIPADDKSGSASQAGVPAFIEFMMKDQPQHQTPMRGGLMWLDNQSNKRFGKKWIDCPKNQQMELIDLIAYPAKTKPDVKQGVAFFNMMRNFTATGFFTSQMGIKDLGYAGNMPNKWEGVPADVLKQYGLSYDS